MAVTMLSIMNPVLGTPDRHRRLPDRRYCDADAEREDVRERRIALVLVDQHEAARIDQSFDAADRSMPRNAGSIMRIAERQLVLPARPSPSSSTSVDVHLAVLDAVDPGVGDPLDVAAAQLALEHRLGVAHAVEPEVADIGLGRDEGHRHPVAQLAAAQLGVEDEGEFVGRPEARCALHGADDYRAGFAQLASNAARRSIGMVDVADRLRYAPRARAPRSRRRPVRGRWR